MHLTSPEKNSHAHSDMPKSVHMHVKNFTCIASIMHVKFEVHMHDKIVSHVWKDFTCNKMHGKKVHTYDKNFSHVLQNFTCTSKSSHACEMLMWWTCIFPNIDFTWFLFFTHFSHPSHDFHTHSPSSGKASVEAYILRGDLTEGFLRYRFMGLIFGGAYFRNFTVFFCYVLFHKTLTFL